ncbi:MAG: TVP38/TMEM64 family protein [Trueperaceae bacterium]
MLRRRASASVAIALWAVLVATTWIVLARAEGGPSAELARWLALVVRPGVGVPVLLVAFAVRPVLLIPVTVLTAFSGWWLGPWLGFAFAWGAVTASAAVPYVLARALRGRATAAASPRGWRGALGRDPFETVLVARLMMLPGDLVSAAAGAVRVPWGPFLGATALGGVPGLAVGVLAGASLDDPDVFTWSAVRIDPATIVAAAVALALAWGLAWVLRRRSRRGGGAR